MSDAGKLRLLAPHDNHYDSARKRQSTEERRQRDGLLGIGGSVNGADVDNLLARSVRDAMIDKSHGAEDDENESDEHNRFHAFNLLLRGYR